MNRKIYGRIRTTAILFLIFGLLIGILALLSLTTGFFVAKIVFTVMSLLFLLGSIFYFLLYRHFVKREQNHNLPKDER